MKVVLLKEQPKIGRLGQLVEVKPGYFWNYLEPKKIAVLANHPEAKLILAQKREKQAESSHQAEEIKEKIKAWDGKTIELKIKANQKGNLYKAVSRNDLAKKLNLSSAWIENVSLKSAGSHKVKIGKGDVSGQITVKILSE